MTEIKVEDLVKKCEECGSTGSTMNGTTCEFPRWGALDSVHKCIECSGNGGELTPTGEVIRDFVFWLRHTGQIGSD